MNSPRKVSPDAFMKACPSRALFSRLSEKWTLLAIVALADGPQRFGAVRRRLEGVTQKVLTQTLRKLEADGLISRKIYDEMPLRVEYTLTDRGRNLLPFVEDMKAWTERNFVVAV